MDTFRTIQDARATLDRQTRVDLRDTPIEITVADGALVLSGEVTSIAKKRVAVHALEAKRRLQRVVDELRVRPTVRQGDGAIRDEIYEHLAQEPRFSTVSIRCSIEDDEKVRTRSGTHRSGTIDATVSDGVITLAGDVQTPVDKLAAGWLAWNAPGCREVKNWLDVGQPSERDAAILGAIGWMFERHPPLRAAHVNAEVRGGIVTLTGQASRAQKHALQGVWYIDGVHDLVDRTREVP